VEEFLNRYDGTLIVISHDRHFLNNVCTHIADIDYETIITYNGGYDDMVLAKTQVRTRVEADNEQREKKIAQLQDFIARFSAGTRASQVMSRKKEVERLQTTDLARSNIQRPYIKFTMNRPSGRVALECSGIRKSFGDASIVADFAAIVNRGEKIVLVGRNGLGKTTLLKALLSDAPNLPASPQDLDAGVIRWGHEVSIGYFPQDHTGAIERGLTAVEWLHRFDPDASRQDIHGLLGQMLFSGEEGLKPTHALSGGETARLLFCRIMLQKPNVLVLDEPTNHLDLESINALNVALQKYDGTVFLVTHDEDLMEEVGTRVWHFDQGKIHDFKGTYEEYSVTVA
jgi:ATPase subunit of ABC transporter with duplicated ATPase domains